MRTLFTKMLATATVGGFQRRVVHLDLKGSRMPMTYLLRLLPAIKSWGATGILIEYEDMFPFDGDLSFIPCAAAYTRDEILALLTTAEALGLDSIPLVQSLGHAEYLLKHPAASALRERQHAVMDMCVTHPGTLALVRGMIAQIAALHDAAARPPPDDAARRERYMHVGLDEVGVIAECDRCCHVVAQLESGTEAPDAAPGMPSMLRSSRELDARSKLFMHHVLGVAQAVQEAGFIPIAWHDVILSLHADALKLLAGTRMQLCLWAYTASLTAAHMKALVAHTVSHGVPVWGASAFRGAAAPDACALIHCHRYCNTATWVAAVADQSGVQGLMLTGWARFTHTCALCEPLPAALLSLCVCLAIARGHASIACAALAEMDESVAIAMSAVHVNAVYHDPAAPPCSCMSSDDHAVDDDAVVSAMEEFMPMDALQHIQKAGRILSHHTGLPGCGMLRYDALASREGRTAHYQHRQACCSLCACIDAVHGTILRSRDARRMFVPPFSRQNTHTPEWARLIRSCSSAANALVALHDALLQSAREALLDDDIDELVSTKVVAFRRDALCLLEDLLAQVPAVFAHSHSLQPEHDESLAPGVSCVDTQLSRMCDDTRTSCFTRHGGPYFSCDRQPSRRLRAAMSVEADMASLRDARARAQSRMSVDDDTSAAASASVWRGGHDHMHLPVDATLSIVALAGTGDHEDALSAYARFACALLQDEAVVRARAWRRASVVPAAEPG